MKLADVDHFRAAGEAMAPQEAWARVRGGGEGRLHHHTGVGSRHAVLSYAVDVDGVWLRIPDSAASAHSTVGTAVTFEIDGTGDDGSEWIALVSGIASEGTNDHPDVLLTLPADLTWHWVFVPATVVEGHRCGTAVAPYGLV